MVSIELSRTLEAATALRLAGRWDVAAALLGSAEPDTAQERLALAVAVADVEVDASLWLTSTDAEAALERAETALADVRSPAPEVAWDLDLLRMRCDYHAALRADPRDASQGTRLAAWADRLRTTAPDPGRSGWAAFFGGVIADNLLTEPDAAGELYRRAQESAETAGDQLLESYTLRRLGDHSHTAGDLAATRRAWIRSTSLRDQLGFVPGAMAQRLALAELLLAEGDPAGAAALAADAGRTIDALGITGWLPRNAADLLERAKAGGAKPSRTAQPVGPLQRARRPRPAARTAHRHGLRPTPVTRCAATGRVILTRRQPSGPTHQIRPPSRLSAGVDPVPEHAGQDRSQVGQEGCSMRRVVTVRRPIAAAATSAAALLGCLPLAGCVEPRDGSYLQVEVAAAVCERPPIGAMDTRCSHVLPKDAVVRVYDGTQVVDTGNPEEGQYRVRLRPGTYRVVASAYLFGIARHTAVVATGHTTTVLLHLSPVPVATRARPVLSS